MEVVRWIIPDDVDYSPHVHKHKSLGNPLLHLLVPVGVHLRFAVVALLEDEEALLQQQQLPKPLQVQHHVVQNLLVDDQFVRVDRLLSRSYWQRIVYQHFLHNNVLLHDCWNLDSFTVDGLKLFYTIIFFFP